MLESAAGAEPVGRVCMASGGGWTRALGNVSELRWIRAVPVSWLENTCDSVVIFWSFIASFFSPHSASQDKLKGEQEKVWEQQSSGLLEKEFDGGNNRFDQVKFMKWWYEMEKSGFNIGRDQDFFLHVHFGWTEIFVRACANWGTAPWSGKRSQDVVLRGLEQCSEPAEGK